MGGKDARDHRGYGLLASHHLATKCHSAEWIKELKVKRMLQKSQAHYPIVLSTDSGLHLQVAIPVLRQNLFQGSILNLTTS